jgi:hypothetical protein
MMASIRKSAGSLGELGGIGSRCAGQDRIACAISSGSAVDAGHDGRFQSAPSF